MKRIAVIYNIILLKILLFDDFEISFFRIYNWSEP